MIWAIFDVDIALSLIWFLDMDLINNKNLFS